LVTSGEATAVWYPHPVPISSTRASGAALEKSLGHARDDVGLGDRLAEANRQGRVLVGAAAERLVDKDVSRHIADAFEPTAGLAMP